MRLIVSCLALSAMNLGVSVTEPQGALMIKEPFTLGAMNGSALQQLIQQALDAKGWTLADLQRETQRRDPDHRGIAYSSMAAWMRPQGRSVPRPENLDVVADALGLDRGAVHAAARAAGGYRVAELDTDDPELQVFLASYRELTEPERARLLRIVRNVVNDPDLFPGQGGGRGHNG